MSTPDVLSLKLEMLHHDVVEVKTALNKLSEAITKLALVEQQQLQTVRGFGTGLSKPFHVLMTG